MKDDIDSDEYQMRVPLAMGAISQGLRGALKHSGSLVSAIVHLGSACMGFICPRVSFS